jgi:hypothetical protein
VDRPRPARRDVGRAGAVAAGVFLVRRVLVRLVEALAHTPLRVLVTAGPATATAST